MDTLPGPSEASSQLHLEFWPGQDKVGELPSGLPLESGHARGTTAVCKSVTFPRYLWREHSRAQALTCVCGFCYTAEWNNYDPGHMAGKARSSYHLASYKKHLPNPGQDINPTKDSVLLSSSNVILKNKYCKIYTNVIFIIFTIH